MSRGTKKKVNDLEIRKKLMVSRYKKKKKISIRKKLMVSRYEKKNNGFEIKKKKAVMHLAGLVD